MDNDLTDLYIAFRSNPDNDSLSDSHFCELHEVRSTVLDEIKKKTPSIAKQCLEARRTKYSEKIQEIDDALFAAAKAGDTKAAELIYRRFDGYDPKRIDEKQGVTTFADLIKAVHKKNQTKTKD